jgi:hypothetical protein
MKINMKSDLYDGEGVEKAMSSLSPFFKENL